MQIVVSKLHEIDRPENSSVRVNLEQLNQSDIVEQMIYITSKLCEIYHDSSVRKEGKYVID